MRTITKCIAVFLAFAFLVSGCAVPDGSTNRPAPTPRKLSDFEREVKAMKTANFQYIFVFRRKDGEVLTDEDKQFIREKAHYATNRFSLSKDGKTVFAGSNFKFDDDSLNELKERFDFQDFSKPPNEAGKGSNSGTNDNGNGNRPVPEP